ncbi:TPA: acylphosphatase [bacterium]|nr:acylphosphatase [bacterium]
MNICCHILVSGLVQGVFFRANTKDVARSLGLVGWVRNLKNGKVEVYAEGKEEDIKRLVEWCRRGPRGARVSDIKVEYGNTQDGLDRFEVRYF